MRRYDWSASYCMIYACVQGSWRSLIWDLKRIRKQVEKSAVNLVGSPILRTLALTGPPPINIDYTNDATGGSASNALFGVMGYSIARATRLKSS